MSVHSIKDKLIREINQIDDENLLRELYGLLHDIGTTHPAIKLNAEQQILIEEAREEYRQGKFLSTEEVFKELTDE